MKFILKTAKHAIFVIQFLYSPKNFAQISGKLSSIALLDNLYAKYLQC